MLCSKLRDIWCRLLIENNYFAVKSRLFCKLRQNVTQIKISIAWNCKENVPSSTRKTFKCIIYETRVTFCGINIRQKFKPFLKCRCAPLLMGASSSGRNSLGQSFLSLNPHSRALRGEEKIINHHLRSAQMAVKFPTQRRIFAFASKKKSAKRASTHNYDESSRCWGRLHGCSLCSRATTEV